MKKEYLDKLYEQRAKVQEEIDKLITMTKDRVMSEDCKCEDLEMKLIAKRTHIYSINHLIHQYLEIHK